MTTQLNHSPVKSHSISLQKDPIVKKGLYKDSSKAALSSQGLTIQSKAFSD